MPFDEEIRFDRTRPDSNHDVLSEEVDRVEEMVELGISPYEAWLEELKKPPEELSELLGITPQAADFYLSTNTASPHRINVRRMCDKLGIHPAYLQPALRLDYDVPYHSSILDAICDVLKDSRVSWEYRAMSMDALQREQKKFELFSRLYPERASFLVEAMSYMVVQNPEITKVESLDSLKWDFNQSLKWPVDDIEKSLALYEMRLHSEFHQSFREEREGAIEAGWLHKALIGLGNKLYGEEFSERNLIILADKILEMNSTEEPVPQSFWTFFKPAILRDFSLWNNKFDLLDAPTLQPDFKAVMRGEGLPYTKIKAEFMKLLPEYIEKKRVYINSSQLNADHFRKMTDFASWMENKETHTLDIPLYRNYCVATHHIAKASIVQGIEFNSVLARHWK